MLKVTNITSVSGRTSSRLEIEDAQIKSLPLVQLCGLIDVVVTVRDVTLGLVNQPKFDSDEDEWGHNAAGQLIERLLGFLDGLETTIAEAIRATECISKYEISRKYASLVHYTADQDDLAELITITAQAMAEQESLRRHKKREAAA